MKKVLLIILLYLIAVPAYARENSRKRHTDPDTEHLIHQLEETILKIKESYYEDIPAEELVKAALKGIVASLDSESKLQEVSPSSLEFVRGFTEENSIPEARLIDINKEIGYIKITYFGRRTGKEFSAHLYKLEGQALQKNGGRGLKGLILDLRDNFGGNLESALEVLDNFIPKNKPILTETYRGKVVKVYFSRGSEPKIYPIIVLTNTSTASSAEIVAATLQYYLKATIVGSKTRGKGTLQEPIPINSTLTLLLTVGEYRLANGSSLKGTGVAPDRAVEDTEDLLSTALGILSNSLPH